MVAQIISIHTNELLDGTPAVDVTVRCPVCGHPGLVEKVAAEGLQEWQAGQNIQHALPALNADQRELLLTGTHRECFDKAYSDDDPFDISAEVDGDDPLLNS